MNLVVWLIVGGLMGVVASMVMRTEPRQRLAMNMVAGVSGALLGGWLISPHVGGGSIDQTDFSGVGLLVSLGGTVAVLAVTNLLGRQSSS